MAEQKNVQEQDINQLLKVRREKLADLQENGKDPFVITKFDVTNHSTDIKENYEQMEISPVFVLNTNPVIPIRSPTSIFLKSL